VTHTPLVQVSPRQSLHDIFDLMFESPNHSILEQLAHQTSSPHSKLVTELEYVHQTIEGDDTWKLVDELADPVLVLSAKEPHLILKSSMSWCSMMGCKSSQVFGKILENFLFFPLAEEPTAGAAVAIGAPVTSAVLPPNLVASVPPSSASPSMQYEEITATLAAFYQMLLANEANHFHCVLPLQHCQTHKAIQCSIHCFPIYKRLSDDEELAVADKPRYFLQRSSRDSSSQINQTVAFHLMYFHPFLVDPIELNARTASRSRLRSRDEVGGVASPSVSTTEMSPLSSQLSSTSMSTTVTEKLRKQGLANDL
jgi:hypothetical protein